MTEPPGGQRTGLTCWPWDWAGSRQPRTPMVEMGVKVRDLYAAGADRRVAELVDDRYLADLADDIAGRLGGRVGVAPRLYAKKLVSDVLTWQVPRLAGAAPSYQSRTLLRQRPTE